jgi:NAD(P)-dependent dehydrogenase (short-subunit alcohol dehydrogenase family)
MSLVGKNAVVTGGASGIGLATSRRFAREGACVAIWDVDDVGSKRAAGWGRVINISSSSAQSGSARMTTYAASKGGVIAFTKSLAIELAATGITVNNIPPGFVDTPMLRASDRPGAIDVAGGRREVADEAAGKSG